MRTISILGAGISGLTAAINLVKAGYDVHIYERNKTPGLRFGGDLQGLENWSEEEDILIALRRMNIKINFDHYAFSEVSVSDGSRINGIKFKKPVFYLVKRGNVSGSLDSCLAAQALDAGIKIHFNETISPQKADIIATGPIQGEIFAMAKGIAFETSASDMIIGILNDKSAYKGYSYLMTAKGYGCICSVVFGDFKRINDCFEETKKLFSKLVKIDYRNIRGVGGVGSFSNRNIFKLNNSFITGEAAGLQDILWGFGMRYAFESGYLASQCIISGDDYEKKAEEKFSSRLKASIVNRFFWEMAIKTKSFSFIVNRAEKKENLTDFLRSYYNFNLIQKTFYPLALMYTRKQYPNLRI